VIDMISLLLFGGLFVVAPSTPAVLAVQFLGPVPVVMIQLQTLGTLAGAVLG